MDRLQRRALNEKHKRQQERPEKAPNKPAKRRTALKGTSAKQKDKNALLHQVYDEMAASQEHVCTGCGRRDVPLSHSHIIARSRRPDLIAAPDNITYQCLSMGQLKGCHDTWEHGDFEQKKMLEDFEDRMLYIYRTDIKYFNLLLLKWGVEEHDIFN
jgi:hypothetical protein